MDGDPRRPPGDADSGGGSEAETSGPDLDNSLTVASTVRHRNFLLYDFTLVQNLLMVDTTLSTSHITFPG